MSEDACATQITITETGFPAEFAWGAATAAYQIEGAAAADGKGESIWDRFSHTPGAIGDGSTGDVACDHYRLWQDDLDLLASLRLNAYRFSVSWPRVFPEGRGAINPAGLDFYDRLVEGLLARGIAPFITLYHWDLPQALQEKGGWENRDTAFYFADFALALARRLGDRVGRWITHNEPHVVVYEGYVKGDKAPGIRKPSLILPISHHLLLSHGAATEALRSELPETARIGITLNFADIEPATDREADIQAARVRDGLWHRLYLDPLYHGAYPEDILPLVSAPPDLIRDGDLERIATPTDFLGVNYYTRSIIRAGRNGPDDPRSVPPRGALTTMRWEVYPEGLTHVLRRLRDDYSPKALYVTENGAAYPDSVAPDGRIYDTQRETYIRRHLQATRDALAEGVPVRGYFVWSLMDNFEWQHGYAPRFGVAYTDYATQQRIPKESARFLAAVAATNGDALDE